MRLLLFPERKNVRCNYDIQSEEGAVTFPKLGTFFSITYSLACVAVAAVFVAVVVVAVAVVVFTLI